MDIRTQPRWAMAIGMGMAAAITVGAQTPTPSGQRPGTNAQDSARGSVTATGCLERAPAAGAASDNAGTHPKAEGGFVLRNVQMSEASTPGTAGSTGAAASDRTGRSIGLVAGPGVDFIDHIGHQVSVTGIMTDMPVPEGTPPDRPAHTTGQPPTPDNPRGSLAPAGSMLTVSRLSMVAATCRTGA